jgi:hypothetical protein
MAHIECEALVASVWISLTRPIVLARHRWRWRWPVCCWRGRRSLPDSDLMEGVVTDQQSATGEIGTGDVVESVQPGGESRPPVPPFTRETATRKVPCGGQLEYTRPGPRRTGLFDRFTVAEPRGVRERQARDRRALEAQMVEGVGVPIDQGAVGLRRCAYCGTVCVRVPRRLRQLVPVIRQRELGVQRTRLDGQTLRIHQ